MQQASVWGDDVRQVLRQAAVPTTRFVKVGGQVIEIPTPFPSPEDWRDTWIYFLLIDRFDNPSAPPRHQPWDDAYGDFQGGNFAGIRQRLDYLRHLGVGALWLSPALKNSQYSASYHGYGIQDFLRIDPRFSSDPARAKDDPAFVEQELRQLVDEAHARGIYVIFDIVLHHTGDVFAYDGYGSVAPWRDQPPYTIYWRDEQGQPRTDWTEAPTHPPLDAAVWPQELQNNALFRRQGNAFDRPPALSETGGDFYSLKELLGDFQAGRRYPVRDTLIRAYCYIIAKFDIDGFRIDTLKYISPAFARDFGNAIREFALSIGKKDFFTYGEIYDDEDKIARFIGRNTLQAGDIVGVDAALDFPLFYHLPAMAKGEAPPSDVVNMYQYRKQVENTVLSSHGDATNFFVTFLDNHDQTQRFNYRGDNPAAYSDQITLGFASLFTLPGIPCLYYGAEQDLMGHGNAPEAVREALWGKPGAFDEHAPFFQVIQQLAVLRRDYPTLRYGRHYFRPISGDGVHFGISSTAPGILAYSRILYYLETLIVVNTSLESGWTGEVILDEDLNSAGDTFAILFSNKAQPQPPEAVSAKPENSVVIVDPDGVVTNGPIVVLPVHLQPLEIQILGRKVV